MEKEKFSPGDTVRLNSGGPLMTVEGGNSVSGWIKCVWFSQDIQFKPVDGINRNVATLCRGEFPAIALSPYRT